MFEGDVVFGVWCGCGVGGDVWVGVGWFVVV